MRNFAYPYFAANIYEFWQRWHISLSTWFRDYVYITLGGNRKGPFRTAWNLLVTFVVSGFWHGANWTFIFWGLIHGVFYIPNRLLSIKKITMRNPGVASAMALPVVKACNIVMTFTIVLVGWIFFRSSSLGQATEYLGRMIYGPHFGNDYSKYLPYLLYAFLPLTVEWFQKNKQHGLEIGHTPIFFRWGVYFTAIISVLLFGNFGSNAFIYFQF